LKLAASCSKEHHCESRLDRLGGSPRCLCGSLGLSKRQLRMAPSGGGQFDTVHAAARKLDADLIFEIADLATEGRLRRVQP
jgi:hypothetical protein